MKIVVNFVGLTDHSSKKGVNKGEREKLGVAPVPKPRSASRTPPPEPANAMQKVEVSALQMLWITCIHILMALTYQTGIYLRVIKTRWRKPNKMMHFQI